MNYDIAFDNEHLREDQEIEWHRENAETILPPSLISALKHSNEVRQARIDNLMDENIILTALLSDMWERRYGTTEGFDSWLKGRIEK
jgi:hypothetical protein